MVILICPFFCWCSEISKAQDRLTDLLQNIYESSPSYRELLRMIMSTVGRGGEGDVGQRIRDEILVIQVDNSDLLFVYFFHLHTLISCLWTSDQKIFGICREIMIARVEWWRNGIRSCIITLAPMMLWSVRYSGWNYLWISSIVSSNEISHLLTAFAGID